MTDPKGMKNNGSGQDETGTIELTVGPEEADSRLDAFLADSCPDYSRSRIHGDIEQGHVSVNGRSRRKSHRLVEGDAVLFTPGERPGLTAVPQDIPLNVVHRDQDLLIIDKVPGMVVHPAVGHPDGTVVNALLHLLGAAPGGGDPLRPGIVHRLDRDTSGLMAVALTEQAHTHLSDQLRDHRVARTYLALSWGRWDESAGTLTGDIGRHPRFRQKMAVVERDGRSATTHYEVLEDFGFVQLCRVRLETGRTHQIRVHFSHRRHPIVGDLLYGDDQRIRGIHGLDRPAAQRMLKLTGRQFLHAAGLRLEHPADGLEMEFEAPLPEDLAAVLEVLRKASPA